MKDLSKTEINLDLDDKYFEELLTYLKTGSCNITLDNHSYLLKHSEELGVSSLTESCVKFILKFYSSNLCSLFLKISKGKYGSKLNLQFMNHVEEYLINDSQKFFNSPDFVNLSEEVLYQILSRDKLSLDEYEIYQFLMKWAKNKQKETKQDIPKIVEKLKGCIRLPLICPDNLITMRDSEIFTLDEFIQAYEYNLDNSMIVEEKKYLYVPRVGGTNFKIDIKTNAYDSYFTLSNKDTTCVKSNGSPNWESAMVYGTKGFNSGVHYWEIKIDSISSDKSGYVVGIVNNPKLKQQYSSTISVGMCGSNYLTKKKAGFNPKMGGKVGVYLDFNSLTVSFTYDGKLIAYADLTKGQTYYPVVHLYYVNDSFSVSFPSKPNFETVKVKPKKKKRIESDSDSDEGLGGLFGDDEFVEKKPKKKVEKYNLKDKKKETDSDEGLGGLFGDDELVIKPKKKVESNDSLGDLFGDDDDVKEEKKVKIELSRKESIKKRSDSDSESLSFSESCDDITDDEETKVVKTKLKKKTKPLFTSTSDKKVATKYISYQSKKEESDEDLGFGLFE